MRRQGLFWGSVILLLGALLLLQTLGVFSFNVWGVFWALFLIFLGVWFLFDPGSVEVRSQLRVYPSHRMAQCKPQSSFILALEN